MGRAVFEMDGVDVDPTPGDGTERNRADLAETRQYRLIERHVSLRHGCDIGSHAGKVRRTVADFVDVAEQRLLAPRNRRHARRQSVPRRLAGLREYLMEAGLRAGHEDFEALPRRVRDDDRAADMREDFAAAVILDCHTRRAR